MPNVQIRGCKDLAWVSLPYMVADEEIDHLIATWHPHWKLGFKSGMKDTARRSTAKVTLPDTTKETKGQGKSTRKGVDLTSQKGSQ